MNYIDIHCHLDSKEFDSDRGEILARMKEGGVGAITIGADFQSSKRAVEIAEANENVWACIGVHPEYSSVFPSPEHGEGGVGFLEELVKSPKVVGIGECGLDYFRINSDENKKVQKLLFESQIQFAIKRDKPLMLHCREAYEDTLDILKTYKKEAGEKLRGNVHFFAGNTDVAREILDLGFTMSFTGVITFTRDYNEVIKYIPIESIMSETDAPFVSPAPYRGKRNEPIYVIEVVQKMAEIRGENMDILNKTIINNAKRVFGI